MQGSGVTQPVKFLTSETRLSVFCIANHQARKVLDNNIALV